MYEYLDSGGFGRGVGNGGGSPDQIVTWGGPIVTFRWDTASDVDFKNLSVREITPTPGGLAGNITPAPPTTLAPPGSNC